MVIEDEPGISGFLKQGLEEESYAVDAAEEGKKGLQMALSTIFLLPKKGFFFRETIF